MNVPGTALTNKSVEAHRPNAEIRVEIFSPLYSRRRSGSTRGRREGHYSCFHYKAKQQLICITDCRSDKALRNDARLEGRKTVRHASYLLPHIK